MQTSQLTPTVRSHSKQRVVGRRVNLKAHTKKLASGQVVIMLQKSANVIYSPAFNESTKLSND